MDVNTEEIYLVVLLWPEESISKLSRNCFDSPKRVPRYSTIWHCFCWPGAKPLFVNVTGIPGWHSKSRFPDIKTIALMLTSRLLWCTVDDVDLYKVMTSKYKHTVWMRFWPDVRFYKTNVFVLTLSADVKSVYSDSQSQFLLKVFTACVVRRTPTSNQDIFFRALDKVTKIEKDRL